MKKVLLLVLILIFICTSVNALSWSPEGNCFKSSIIPGTADELLMCNKTGSQNFTVPSGITNISYLIVAGGGSGGAVVSWGTSSGGGGAGGILVNTTGGFPVKVGDILNLTVGDAGANQTSDTWYGNNGFNSSITNSTMNITAVGGGGGGGYGGSYAGRNGGSGGGGGYASNTNGTGIAGQGNAGGAATGIAEAGGGGGYGSVGTTGGTGQGGTGGIFNITGESLLLGIGGNGGQNTTTNCDTYGIAATGNGGHGQSNANVSCGYQGKSGGSGLIILRYMTGYPVASFTSNISTGTAPLSVQFNDTSVTDITSWNWSYTNVTPGNNTQIWWSTARNATNVFGDGNWKIVLSVTNASGSSLSGDQYISVSDSGGLSGWNRQDILMDQIYTLTLNIKDSASHGGIPGATIMTSNGDNTTTDLFGVSVITTNYTALVVSAGKSGYNSRTLTYVIDRDRNETIYLTATPTGIEPQPFRGTNPLYPQQIQFVLVDRYGHALTGVSTTAEMTSMSINGTNWLTELFQISTNATPINTTVLTDVSDDAGTIVFPMIASGTYRLTFTKPSDGISETKSVHPTQLSYIYILSTTATAIPPNLADSVNASLGTYPPASDNPSVVYLQGNYTDTLSQTTNVTFYVLYPNQTPIYSNSTAGTISSANNQYGVNNTAGNAYVWGISALRGSTYINKSTGITMKGTGQSGLANNLVKLGCNNWGCT